MCAPFFLLALFCSLFASAFLGCKGAGPFAALDKEHARPLRVAAASDVEPAFVELGRIYTATQKGHPKIVFSFASSVALAQQVRQGAPFDVYAAANAELVTRLERGGQLVPGSARPYARGRLVLYTHGGTPAPASLAALLDPSYKRIALANPDHAPYGQAAIEALRNASLFEALRTRLIYGENVRQAHQYVETGNADVALGALSLVRAGAPGRYTLISEALYTPLVQAMGIVAGGNEAGAARFIDLILSQEGQALLQQYGFLPAV